LASHAEFNEFVGKALSNYSQLCNSDRKRETPRTCTTRIQEENPAANLGSWPMGVTGNDGREFCGLWIYVEV
jgi:hypothetical protein